MESIGMFEVAGLSSAVVAANVATQTAAVEVGGFGYLHEGQVMVTIMGSVASVRAAVDAVVADLGGAVRASSVIARPDPQVDQVVQERFVAVGRRVGAPAVPGRGRRFAPSAGSGTDAAPSGAAKTAADARRAKKDSGSKSTRKRTSRGDSANG